jgi:hypothetical protein
MGKKNGSRDSITASPAIQNRFWQEKRRAGRDKTGDTHAGPDESLIRRHVEMMWMRMEICGLAGNERFRITDMRLDDPEPAEKAVIVVSHDLFAAALHAPSGAH